MKSFIVLFSSAVVVAGLATTIFFLVRAKLGKRKEFDASRDLFI